MIVKCTKTGKILATDEEIREHADAFGVAAFEEVNPDTTKIWMNPSSGKYCFSANEMDLYCRRTGEMQASFLEMSVTEFLQARREKAVARSNDPVVEKYANAKMLSALVDVKGHLVLQAEKALWYTRNASVAAAEEWLTLHAKDADINTPLHPSETDMAEQGVASSTPESDSLSEIRLEEYVNQSFVSELESMGFPRSQCLLAVWKTDNAGTGPAVDWLTNDSNLGETTVPEYISVPKPKPKLSKEEAQEAAVALQKKLREQRLEREAAEAREKEKQRILQTKQNLEQQAVLEEAQRKRDILERERQKREAEEHRLQVADKLKQDYIERFGHAPPEDAKKRCLLTPRNGFYTFWGK